MFILNTAKSKQGARMSCGPQTMIFQGKRGGGRRERERERKREKERSEEREREREREREKCARERRGRKIREYETREKDMIRIQ